MAPDTPRGGPKRPRAHTAPGSMRLFVSYGAERVTMDVGQDQSVRQVKEVVREIFRIGSDEGPTGAEVQERKILSLVYAGSDLNNAWLLTDLGIAPGSTLKAVLKDEVKPSLFVYCSFNRETIPLLEKINTRLMTLATFRGIVSRKTGLPVSAFRLMSGTGEDAREMFDAKVLDDYDISLGDTVKLETWDGWTEMLLLAINGFASQLMGHLSSDDVVARFQTKVALYIAAHFGQVDLAVSLLRYGIRADDPVGEHPLRMWCKHTSQHIDCLKAPVHEAAEAGQLGVLRSFVHHNVCNVLAKDGNGLTPLNISLRRRQKPCASFLLTKQWNKINFSKKASIPLSIYCKMKRWADKSRETVLTVHGQWKSSVKNPKRHAPTAALLDHGVQLDGYSRSKLSSKNAAEAKADDDAEERRKKPLFDIEEEERRGRRSPSPDVYFKTLASINTVKLPKLNKMGRIMSKAAQEQMKKDEESNKMLDSVTDVSDSETLTQPGSDTKRKSRPRSRSESKTDHSTNVRLPPITESKSKPVNKQLSLSHQNLTTGNNDDQEFRGNGKIRKSRSLYLKTGPGKSSTTDARTGDRPDPEDDGDLKTPNKKRSDQHVKSMSVLTKSFSPDNTPRPFIRSRSEDLTTGTLSLYEKYRGQGSRDYAMNCLAVASSFKEKAWLQQVNQAMIIARRGVKKIVDGQPSLFGTGATSPIRARRVNGSIVSGPVSTTAGSQLSMATM